MRKAIKLYKLSVVDRDRVQVRIPDWDRRTVKHLLEIEAADRFFTVRYLKPVSMQLFTLCLKGCGQKSIEGALLAPGTIEHVSDLTIPQRMLQVTAEAINAARLRLNEMQR